MREAHDVVGALGSPNEKKEGSAVMVHRRIHVVCAALGLAAVAVAIAARPGSSQPPAEAGLEQAIRGVQQQAVRAWVDIAEQLADDPLFLERGGEEAEQFMARAEGLQMTLHGLIRVMSPPRPDRELPPSPGRFQFVEWAQEPMQYWVLDTATGELQRRQAPH